MNRGLDKTALDDKDLEVACRMAVAKMMMVQAERYYRIRKMTQEEWAKVQEMTDSFSQAALVEMFGADAFNFAAAPEPIPNILQDIQTQIDKLEHPEHFKVSRFENTEGEVNDVEEN